ncbi:MAG: hypothetical protein PUI48_05960 [Oscillospiraceae bacterium]|nr:hypothetical protein [Oscillospiraceae bacterium]MDY6208341.1 hypothetical protein [Oscillospiraceae bacterium]
MLSYGYIISNLPRHERFNEAEWLLDKLLKDYSKGSKQFEEDGSISLAYSKETEEGEKQVVLKRNVTESYVAVFSDIPLKIFKFGGFIFYLRDIIPSLVFFMIYFIWGIDFNKRLIISGIPADRLIAIVGGAAAGLIINLLTRRLISKNRSYDRICCIQFGGLFSLIYILAVMVKYSGTGIMNFWIGVLSFSTFIESVGGMALTRLMHLFEKDN